MSDQLSSTASDKKLFSEFEPVSREKWFLKVMEELKGKDFDKTLNWHPFKGSTIFPVYTQQDLKKTQHLASYQHASGNKENPHLGARAWKYLETIKVEDFKSANRNALKALNNGADGICFQLNGMISFHAISALLNDIKPQFAEVSFQTNSSPLQLLGMYRSYLMENGISFSDIEGKLFYDYSDLGTVTLREVVKMGLDLPGFKVLCIAEDSVGTEAEKLGSILLNWHKVIDLLKDEEVEEGMIASQSFFHLKHKNQFFLELARTRALRFLATEWLSFFGIDESPERWTIHSETQIDVLVEDESSNIISNAGQAMSAILGGCNSLSIQSHQKEKKNTFSDRISRNISTLLREESYLDKVSDPASGSYFIETLTDHLAEKAWEHYRENLA